MKTNRDQILQDAFVLFMQMNYEKASFAKLQEATRLTSAGITHHFGNKLNLFIAVVDKYFLEAQTYSNKFDLQCSTLQEFIDIYIEGIENTVDRLKSLSRQQSVREGSRNYYQFLNQACLYYPGFEEKCFAVFQR
ncbi:MAG: TetR/AcrR family transcriptional regulator [Parabacteroides sp.]|nr:TetR/AcrR family transcriptional regulator [Parabacteroides sp.]